MKTYREILENYAIADHILEVLHTYFDECLASGLTEVTVFSKCYILGKFYQLFDHNIKLTDTHLNKIYKIAYLKLCENKALSRKREIQTVIRTFVSWMLRNDIVEEDATRAFPKISLRNYEYAANENHKTRQAFNDTLRPVIEIELKRMKLPLHYRLCLITMV